MPVDAVPPSVGGLGHLQWHTPTLARAVWTACSVQSSPPPSISAARPIAVADPRGSATEYVGPDRQRNIFTNRNKSAFAVSKSPPWVPHSSASSSCPLKASGEVLSRCSNKMQVLSHQRAEHVLFESTGPRVSLKSAGNEIEHVQSSLHERTPFRVRRPRCAEHPIFGKFPLWGRDAADQAKHTNKPRMKEGNDEGNRRRARRGGEVGRIKDENRRGVNLNMPVQPRCPHLRYVGSLGTLPDRERIISWRIPEIQQDPR